jgi:hypothetical protein
MKRGVTQNRPVFTTLGVRVETKQKYNDFSNKHRLDFADVADIAIEALGLITPEQRQALIERRPYRRRSESAVAPST